MPPHFFRFADLDSRWFGLINGSLSCGFLDLIMPVITDFAFWVPLLLPVWLYLLLGGQGRQRALAIMIVLAITAADQASSGLIKPLVRRPRPCCVEEGARKLIGCKTSKSFPSSHASNTAAVAAVIIARCGWVTGLPFLAISACVAYSRVYVGVHYPFDVLYGMALGLFCGWLVARVVASLARRSASRSWFARWGPVVLGKAFVDESLNAETPVPGQRLH